MKYEVTARRLREALSDMNMTQQELADKSGISKASISHYTNGANEPGNKSAYELAKVLNVNPAWLMGLSVPKQSIEDIERELVKKRLEYISTDISDAPEMNRLEFEMDELEKNKEYIEKLDKFLLCIPDAIIEEAETKEATNKALLLFRRYQNAPANIQSAIDSLLGSVPPKP